jgi:type 1 glutamine amidotransferase
VIWTNQYGKARVFGTTLGHHNETMGHEVYLDFVSRGLLWACDKLGEDGKPKAGYEKQR